MKKILWDNIQTSCWFHVTETKILREKIGLCLQHGHIVK